MRSRIVSFFKGSIRAEIYGQHPEALLNKCTEAGISPWDVSIHNKTLRLCMHVRDFFRLRPLLKETGCRIRVRERKGFPFYLNRLEKRKTLCFRAVVFFHRIVHALFHRLEHSCNWKRIDSNRGRFAGCFKAWRACVAMEIQFARACKISTGAYE